MRLALYQPDIPQNAGTLIRVAACLGVPLDIIEPCGFVITDRHFRRAGLDYFSEADLTRHASWEKFLAARPEGRLLLLTTRGEERYDRFAFAPGDALLLGRETAGVPDEVHATCDARLRIPMRPGMRSINVAIAASVVLAEALRQTGLLPEEQAAHRLLTERRQGPAAS